MTTTIKTTTIKTTITTMTTTSTTATRFLEKALERKDFDVLKKKVRHFLFCKVKVTPKGLPVWLGRITGFDPLGTHSKVSAQAP